MSLLSTYRNWPIGRRITFSSSARVLIIVLVLTFVAVFFSTRALHELSTTDLEHIADNAYTMCEVQREQLDKRLEEGQVMAAQLIRLKTKSAADLQTPDALRLTSESTRIGNFTVPNLYFVNYLFTGDTDFVDEIKGKTGMEFTIFQVIDNQWVRVATTIREAGGQRAVGTTLDANSNVYKAVMETKTPYMGVVNAVGHQFEGRYAPLMDTNGRVIAVLFIGLAQDQFVTLPNAIKGIKIGKGGYAYAMNGQGITTIHPTRVGLDLSKEAFFQEMTSKKSGVIPSYVFEGKRAVVAYRYFKPYDWYIVAKANYEDFQAPAISMRNIMLLCTVFFLALGIYTSHRNSLAIVRPIADLINRLRDITQGRGDLSQRVVVVAKDEIGELGRRFNGFLAVVEQTVKDVDLIAEGNYEQQTGGEASELAAVAESMDKMRADLRKRHAESEQLRADIQSMMQVVSAASEGNFTVEARMSEGMVGILADSFNVMMEDLSSLIRKVREGAQQVGSTTHELMVASEQMAKGADTQSLQIANTTSAIDEMSLSIQSVAENADSAANASRQTVDTANDGGKTVLSAVEAMRRIRETVQRTSQQIKALGESSMEISEIVKVINNIASRTNLLALNATIEAAKAGEAGKGFAVVADEVRKLADQASKASNDIATLVQGIRSDMTVTITSMEKTSGEVEAGSQLAAQAGQALERIVQMAQQSAELIQDISLAAKQQAKASSGIVTSMNQISTISKETATGAQQATQSSSSMLEISEGLSSSVRTFQLHD